MAKKQKTLQTSSKQKYSAPAVEKKPLDKRLLIGGLLALVVTFLCFSPGLDHGFVNWDDDRNIFQNEHITSLNAENFWSNTKDIWTSTVIGNYNPLTIWTFAIEKMTYGMEDLGKWHLTNILLHLICVLLVLRISKLLGLSWQGAVFVAFLFGIHPMRVESVAWLTERKDVLYGAFYLAALWLYVKGKVEHRRYTIWIMLLFILSLFSKIQAVILPVAMVLVDYYLDREFSWKSVVSKLPYFGISLLFGLLGIYFLSGEGSIDSNSNTFEAWQRLFVGSYSYMVYLVKSVVPYQLSPLYPYPHTMPWFFYVSMVMLPIVLYFFYWAYRNEKKVLFFGVGFFTVNIFFLLQILGAGQGFLADRFTYIAYFGLFFMAGYGFDYFVKRKSSQQSLIIGVAALVIAGYSYMTYEQVHIWKDSDTLWSHVLKYYKNSTLPYGNRANYLRDQGRVQEALADYSKSISLNPKGHQAYNSRARLYFNIAKGADTLQLALQDYNRAIELSPNDGEFYVNRGATYARLGQAEKAIQDITKGLELKPDHATGYLNRSVMYNALGNVDLALADITSYLKLRPYDSDLWYEKARAERQLGNVGVAIKSYDRAIELNAGKSLYWYERARTKAGSGDVNGAKVDLRRAIALGHKNIDPGLRQSLGM